MFSGREPDRCRQQAFEQISPQKAFYSVPCLTLLNIICFLRNPGRKGGADKAQRLEKKRGRRVERLAELTKAGF